MWGGRNLYGHLMSTRIFTWVICKMFIWAPKMMHNIIQIHNNIAWDWQYYMEYSKIPSWSIWRREIFYGIMSIPHNIVMDLNNVMWHQLWPQFGFATNHVVKWAAWKKSPFKTHLPNATSKLIVPHTNRSMTCVNHIQVWDLKFEPTPLKGVINCGLL